MTGPCTVASDCPALGSHARQPWAGENHWLCLAVFWVVWLLVHGCTRASASPSAAPGPILQGSDTAGQHCLWLPLSPYRYLVLGLSMHCILMPLPWDPFLLCQVRRWPSSPRWASRSREKSCAYPPPPLCGRAQSPHSSRDTHHISMLQPQLWSSHTAPTAALGVAWATVWGTPAHRVGQNCLCIPPPSRHSPVGPRRTDWLPKCSCSVPFFPWLV